MTRAVIFDVDGVLVHGYHARPEKQVRWDENLLRDLGVDSKRFAEEFIFDVFVKQVVVGRMSLVDALDRVLPRLGYKGATMSFISYWLTHDSSLNQPLLDLVRQLKTSGAASLYIATNQEHLRAHWLWQTMGLSRLFDDIFYSARLGAVKPHRPFFEGVSRHIGPQETPPLFFDDREDIVKSARDFGWEAVLFNELADCADHPWVADRLGAVIA